MLLFDLQGPEGVLAGRILLGQKKKFWNILTFFLLLTMVQIEEMSSSLATRACFVVFATLLVVATSKTNIRLTKASLPSCGGCYSGVNGIFYACCDNMSIDNGVCTCDGDQPCTQCSPSSKDQYLALPGSDDQPCNGCYAEVNGIYYACCSGMSVDNNVCTCNNGNQPCATCSPSPLDKQKGPINKKAAKVMGLTLTSTKQLQHIVKPTELPSCNGCYSEVNGIFYACCNSMSVDNGVCTCDGNQPCTQCQPSAKDRGKPLPSKAGQNYTQCYLNGCATMANNGGPDAQAACNCNFPCFPDCSSSCTRPCMSQTAYNLAQCGQTHSDYYSAFVYACNVFQNSWHDGCDCCHCWLSLGAIAATQFGCHSCN